MKRARLHLLWLMLLASGCGHREHTVLARHADSGPDVVDLAPPAVAGSAGSPPAIPESIPIGCRGRGICETVPMVNDTYSECFNVVLPPELPTDPKRKRVNCALIWRVKSPPLFPFNCDQLPFAESADIDPASAMTVTCSIHQLAVTDGEPDPGEGFYWVDAEHADPPCNPSTYGRIMYTPGAMPVVPGSSVVTWLDCS